MREADRRALGGVGRRQETSTGTRRQTHKMDATLTLEDSDWVQDGGIGDRGEILKREGKDEWGVLGQRQAS